MEMMIESIVKKEAVRNQKMIEEYEAQIRDLPKGSLVCRKGEYYYLKYRKDGKLFDDYVGKDPKVIGELCEKLEMRRHCESMLSALKLEKKTIAKILEGLS